MSNAVTTLNAQEKLLELEVKKFELEQRRAKALSISAFFPTQLKNDIASAVIIYDLANRMDVSVLEIAQSIFIIHGKPSFETKFLVARLNSSGKIKGRLNTIISQDRQSAYCEAIDAQTGQTLRGMTVTMEIARKEGWLSKQGSKWQTMPELMLRYRAQSFFISEFFPEVKFGLKTKEENEDIADAEVMDSKPLNLNEIANETKEDKPILTKGGQPINLNEFVSQNENQQRDRKAEVEIDVGEEVLPLDALQNELVARGIDEIEAEKRMERMSPDEARAYLSDPNAIDTLAEELRSE